MQRVALSPSSSGLSHPSFPVLFKFLEIFYSSTRFVHTGCLYFSLQIETHIDGQRVRYFQDDDNVGLQEMVRREKMSSAQDQNALYSRMAAKVGK